MTVRILVGDCRDRMKELPDQSIHCCVCSPPYFGLRDYGTASWVGGDGDCTHEPPVEYHEVNNRSTALGGGTANQDASDKQRWYNKDGSCRCGATRIDRQMGLEPTPSEYVAGMVEVFREVRRVLRDDGTLWLNIGDSYASGRGESQGVDPKQGARRFGRRPQDGKIPDCKNKDLIGIPWMLAFALRADGWYLRQDIIWSKPNPMPESVRDRCTKAHEYMFLLSKGPRYYFDQDAILEPGADASLARLRQAIEDQAGSDRVPGKTNGTMKAVRRPVAQHKQAALGRNLESSSLGSNDEPLWRNKRSVWEVATQPFSGAHFATFPPALIEPCILAGCPKGGTVLDPFGGAGTTGLVADRLQRNAILIELNPEYAEIARRRLAKDGGMFSDVLAA